jgi:uncharacterized protein (DUF983 family)
MVDLTSLDVTAIAAGFGLSAMIFAAVAMIVMGLALWKAARLNEKMWFWGMIVVSLVVPLIPAIVYLFIRRNKKVAY